MFLYETGRKSLSNTVNIYLFKVNNGNTRTICEIYSKFRGVFKTHLKTLYFLFCYLILQKVQTCLSGDFQYHTTAQLEPLPYYIGRGGGEGVQNLPKKYRVTLVRGTHFFGRNGVATFLLFYISITFILCLGKVRFPIQVFSLLSQPFKIIVQVFIALKTDIICTFLIHYGSVQKLLTALIDFVWNTQKSKLTIFLRTQARCFLVLKRF